MRNATVRIGRSTKKEIAMSRTKTTITGAFLICILALTGCAAETPSGSVDQPEPSSGTTDPGTPAEPEQEPVTQEATCEWGSARLDSGSADSPNSTGGDLATTIIGSWQHTHIDSGSGYEAVKPTTDIRYVFPSTTEMLYCQDVQGATSQAENLVSFELNGTEIVLPSPATGYGVQTWTNDTMVWTNHRDGSLYLLKRR
jgi:hypothetical protein